MFKVETAQGNQTALKPDKHRTRSPTREVSARGVCPREVSVLERFVCFREVSASLTNMRGMRGKVARHARQKSLPQTL